MIRRFLVGSLLSLCVAPYALGQQTARVECINAKAVPLHPYPDKALIEAGQVPCGAEVHIIELTSDGTQYLVEAKATTGQTIRGYLDKFWVRFPPLSVPVEKTVPAAAPRTEAHTQDDSSHGRPSVIGSTYVVTDSRSTHAVHLYEEDGQLTADVKEGWNNVRLPDGTSAQIPDNATPDQMAAFRRKLAARFPGKKIWIPEEMHFHYSVEYERVEYVKADSDLLDRYGGRRHLQIEDSNGHSLLVTLPTEAEAKEVAEYVAGESALGLELIGGAWRVRKPFQCPQDGGLGCRDFKELVDHGDPEIVEYFYSRDENIHNYACFSDEEPRFFVVQYSHIGDLGTFLYEEFEKQQSGRSEISEIRWFPNDSGRISDDTFSIKRGAKPQVLGAIDSSSLSYQNKFENREGTTTQYSVDIRWSTGRFTEKFSGKDKKGELWNFDKTGLCVKLN